MVLSASLQIFLSVNMVVYGAAAWISCHTRAFEPKVFVIYCFLLFLFFCCYCYFSVIFYYLVSCRLASASEDQVLPHIQMLGDVNLNVGQDCSAFELNPPPHPTPPFFFLSVIDVDILTVSGPGRCTPVKVF